MTTGATALLTAGPLKHLFQPPNDCLHLFLCGRELVRPSAALNWFGVVTSRKEVLTRRYVGFEPYNPFVCLGHLH